MVEPEQIKKAFGEVLREERLKAGLSQERLALQCGIDRTFVSMLERGLRQPSLVTLFVVSKELSLSPSELLDQVLADLVNRKALPP
ncbi:helix-turn-helix domain-containing protein [Congregibacter litoralis]|uniref:Putative transcription factor n=1 Tax=Congregibacter litoralis KT71 TaxID=314285 RepID=V7HUV2_9GAMM|nr:putative transcription factor [Congregibacter litoralis KT71]